MKKFFLLLFLCCFSFTFAYHFGIAFEGYPTQADIQKKKKKFNCDFSIILFYLSWPKPKKTLDLRKVSQSLDAIFQENAIPCITWEPWYWEKEIMTTALYQEILQGDYDSYLLDVVHLCKSKNFPIIIRFAHEMNTKKYHWGTSSNDFGTKSPLIYKQIYRYVYNFLKKHDVINVLWSFCPNNDSVPNEYWNKANNYYPGDSYVDILGMDGYNWGNTQQWSSWKSFSTIFKNIRKDLLSLSSSKPLIVWETACTTSGGNRDKWIKEAIITAKNWNLKGLVWFSIKKELDWRLNKKEVFSLAESAKTSSSMQQWAQEVLQ